MSSLPGVNHLNAVRALQKAGFVVQRQGKHITLKKGARVVSVPRHNPIKSFTLAQIVRDAGLTVAEFRALL